MTLYTRHQLIVLLIVLGTAGLGLAVGHWRRARPDLVDRLERLDRIPPPASSEAPPSSAASSPTPPERGPRRAMAGPAERASRQVPLDLNRADVAQLTRLPGVGWALAARIVRAREAAGPFTTVDDLRRVRGLYPTTIDRLRPLVTAGP